MIVGEVQDTKIFSRTFDILRTVAIDGAPEIVGFPSEERVSKGLTGSIVAHVFV